MPTEPLAKIRLLLCLNLGRACGSRLSNVSFFLFHLLSCIHLLYDLCGRNCLYLVPEFVQSFTPLGVLATSEDSEVHTGDYVHKPMVVHTRGEAEIALKS